MSPAAARYNRQGMDAAPEYVAQVVLLRVSLPERPVRNAGVLLLDERSGNLYFRLRDDWDRIAEPEDVELLSELAGDLRKQLDDLGEGGGREFLRRMEDQLSNVLELSHREPIAVTDIRSTLDRLFEESCSG
jgi:hypothetical protein